MVKKDSAENQVLDTKIPKTISLREDFDVEEVGKKIWEKKIVLDEKTKPLKTLLHKHLAFFSDFVELTEEKKVQIRITSQEHVILIELFSFNGATKELIERKYYEYVDYTLSEKNDTSNISFSDKISLIARIQAEGEIAFQKGMFVGEQSKVEKDYEMNIKFADLNMKHADLNKQFAQLLGSSLNPKKHKTASSGLVINNYGNINLSTENSTINQKIEKIIHNNPENKDLKNLLDEVNTLKDKILKSDNLDDETKQESLEYIEEIADNIEQKYQPDKFRLLKKAGRGLLNIASKVGSEVATGYIKKQLGI